MNNNQSGKFAELVASIYFSIKGYSIIKRNHITGKGTGAGEIDLIIKRNNTLVFVEVKKRTDLETAAYAISASQQQRLWKAAENFIQTHPEYADFEVRFDAFLFALPLHYKHIVDAWRLW